MLLADCSLAAFLTLLAELPSADSVAAGISQGALAPFRPGVTAIAFVDVDRHVMTTAGVFGVDPQLRRMYSAMSLDTDLPATVCYRTNSVVTSSAARVADEFPLGVQYLKAGRSSESGEFIAFPLRYRGAVIAVLGLEFAHPVAEPWHLRSAVSIVSGPLSLWAALRQQLDDSPDGYRSRRSDRPLAVSDRQKRIVGLVRAGRTNAQIAREIGFSVPTVKSELARLSALLGATSRVDIAERAARAGF